METFTMSRKELPRPGLLKAALAGKITNREGAAALHLSIRQFQRLKRRYEAGGAPAVRHRQRGQPSPRRFASALREQITTLLQTRYAGFNDTHLTEKLRELHQLPVSRESVRRAPGPRRAGRPSPPAPQAPQPPRAGGDPRPAAADRRQPVLRQNRVQPARRRSVLLASRRTGRREEMNGVRSEAEPSVSSGHRPDQVMM